MKKTKTLSAAVAFAALTTMAGSTGAQAQGYAADMCMEQHFETLAMAFSRYPMNITYKMSEGDYNAALDRCEEATGEEAGNYKNMPKTPMVRGKVTIVFE